MLDHVWILREVQHVDSKFVNQHNFGDFWRSVIMNTDPFIRVRVQVFPTVID